MKLKKLESNDWIGVDLNSDESLFPNNLRTIEPISF